MVDLRRAVKWWSPRQCISLIVKATHKIEFIIDYTNVQNLATKEK